VGPAETLEGMTKSFLTISTGESATTAQPILATSDAGAISAALVALVDRLAPQPSEPARTLDEATP